MPNPRKPQNLKLISGTLQPCRDTAPGVTLPLVATVPTAPDWLPNAHAVREWDRLAPILMANKLLTEGATSVLAVLCALHGKLVQMWAAGEAPTGHMIAQYRNLANDFGLTPIAQGKLKPTGVIESENPFAKFGKRPRW